MSVFPFASRSLEPSVRLKKFFSPFPVVLPDGLPAARIELDHPRVLASAVVVEQHDVPVIEQDGLVLEAPAPSARAHTTRSRSMSTIAIVDRCRIEMRTLPRLAAGKRSTCRPSSHLTALTWKMSPGSFFWNCPRKMSPSRHTRKQTKASVDRDALQGFPARAQDFQLVVEDKLILRPYHASTRAKAGDARHRSSRPSSSVKSWW